MLCLSFRHSYSPTPYKFPDLIYFPKMPISAENPVTYEGAELGKYLFYDAILSQNYKMSCASCHKQSQAFSDAPNAFSVGNQQILSKRNTQPLFNLAWYPAFFWDGRAKTLEKQVFHPVRDANEMNLNWQEAEKRVRKSKFYQKKFRLAFGEEKIDSILISKAIGQFMRTLLSYNSKFDRVLARKDTLTKAEYEGLVLMNDMTKGDCLHCHSTDGDALGTMRIFSNNGLDAIFETQKYTDKGLGSTTQKLQDNGKFKVPSVRNLAFTAPYMHDGRFATLEQVLDFYSEGVFLSANIDAKMASAHQKGVHLTEEEKKNIIAFLKTLNDSSFVKNAEFANPFREGK